MPTLSELVADILIGKDLPVIEGLWSLSVDWYAGSSQCAATYRRV
ncbi:hypothetical protein [Spirosoma fluminis]